MFKRRQSRNDKPFVQIAQIEFDMSCTAPLARNFEINHCINRAIETMERDAEYKGVKLGDTKIYVKIIAYEDKL